MVEKPPLHIYDIYLEVEAHGGHGGIWRPFYLSCIYTLYIHAKYVYVEKYAYIYLLKWASFLDPLHCNEQQK